MRVLLRRNLDFNFYLSIEMLILRRFEDLASLERPVHWALGFFDGLHRGHERIIASSSGTMLPDGPASLRGMLSFAQHPMALLCPEAVPALISPVEEQKCRLAEAMGVDVLLLLPFDAALAELSARDFLDALAATGSVAGLSCGTNWRFGAKGAGDASFLRAYAQEKGWACEVMDLMHSDSMRICSTRIREAVASGDLTLARCLLGRSFSIFGEVEHGQHLARRLNFPTANIALAKGALSPPYGVYAVRARLDGEKFVEAVANLGMRPTIEEENKVLRLESHFFDWDGDLYGRLLDVELLHFIRAEQRFDSVELLQRQIGCDVADAKSFFASAML